MPDALSDTNEPILVDIILQLEQSEDTVAHKAAVAGGIVSDALDGMRCAEVAAKSKGYTRQERRAPEPTTSPPSLVKSQHCP